MRHRDPGFIEGQKHLGAQVVQIHPKFFFALNQKNYIVFAGTGIAYIDVPALSLPARM